MTDSSNITALSHIGVQIFGHHHGSWFSYIPEETAQLQTKCYALLPPHHLLLLLRSPAKMNETQLVEVSREDIGEFNEMMAQSQRIEGALSKYEG